MSEEKITCEICKRKDKSVSPRYYISHWLWLCDYCFEQKNQEILRKIELL